MPASCSETPIFPSSVQGPASGDARVAAGVTGMGSGLNQRIRYLLYCFQQTYGQIAPVGGAPTQLASWNSSTGVWNLPNHGLSTGQPIRFMIGNSGATNPGSCAVNTVYYAIVVDANNFNTSLTSGGAAVAPTGSFAGELYVIALTDPAIYTMATSGTPPLPAAKLSTLLSLFAQYGASNTWTATQTFNAAVIANAALTVGGILGPQAATAPRSKTITATATTFTIDASAPVWILDTPFPGSTTSATMVITIDATTLVPATDQEIEVICFNLNVENATVQILRNVPTTVELAQFVYPDLVASARFKFSGGKWRQVGQPTGVHSYAASS